MQESPQTPVVSTSRTTDQSMRVEDMASLQPGDILRASWNLLKENSSIVLKMFGALILLNIVGNVAIGIMAEMSGLLTGVVQLALIALQVLLSIGLMHMVILIAAGKPAELSLLWKFTDRIIPYIFATILYSIVVSVGLLLLIVPGIIWATKFGMAPLIIAWKKIGADEALRLSGKMTDGYKWQLFILYIIFLVINVLAAVTVVGLLLTLPLSYLAMGVIFNRLADGMPELQNPDQVV